MVALLLLVAAEECVLATSLIDIQSFLTLLMLLLLLWIEDAVWLVVVCADEICD